jgi:lipopolysaccharide export system protein LptC
MPRTHLLILAFGVVLILLAGLGGGSRDEEPSPAATRADGRLGEPDLIMEGAEITQFDAAGTPAYRIIAATITHFPVDDHTLLEAPRVTLYGHAEAPWEISARSGRIEGGSRLLDPGLVETSDADAVAEAPTSDTSGSVEEIVVLEEEVVVRRERPVGDFVELSTSRLDLFPGREYASTDRPVIIDSDSGRTTATGLRAELDTGRLLLGPSASDRVRTTLFPDRLQ